MGTKIFFFKGDCSVTHVYQLIAKCKTCGEIIAAVEDDPAKADENRSVIKTWQDAGYAVDRATLAFVRARFSSRGCVCAKDAS